MILGSSLLMIGGQQRIRVGGRRSVITMMMVNPGAVKLLLPPRPQEMILGRLLVQIPGQLLLLLLPLFLPRLQVPKQVQTPCTARASTAPLGAKAARAKGPDVLFAVPLIIGKMRIRSTLSRGRPMQVHPITKIMPTSGGTAMMTVGTRSLLMKTFMVAKASARASAKANVMVVTVLRAKAKAKASFAGKAKVKAMVALRAAS